MTEAAQLAKAGSAGLALILDMLTDEKIEFNRLTRNEQDRYRDTFSTFFGQITKKDQYSLFRKRASFIKTILDRIAPLTPESWPSSITLFCDTTYYSDEDRSGKTWNQMKLPGNKGPQPAIKGLEWKYDEDQMQWLQNDKNANCDIDNTSMYAFTEAFSADRRDRITICPALFTKVQSPEAGKSFTDIDPAVDIQVGTMLDELGKNFGRM